MPELKSVEKILVAEDNDFVRMQIVKYLRDEGYEVEEAVTGGEAVDLVDGGADYGLAIVDLRMEPMGGFEFIKHMRGENNMMPAILVTGDQDPNLLNEAGKWDVSAVLMKPVQKDRLLKAVEKILLAQQRRSP